jgi:phage terminase large subunit-like protein
LPRPAKVEVTKGLILENLIDGLRRTATKPTIYGYHPMPHQEKFHSSMAKGRLFIGGNRSGKTLGGVCEDVMWITGKHKYRAIPPPPIRGRIIAVDFTQGVDKIILPELAKWIPPSELINGSWEDSYSSRLRTLTLENGSFVELMSYEMDLEKFAGTSRHFVHFDEEPNQAIFNENLARLVDTGGSYWLTMTPVEGMTWTYDTIYIAARTNPNFFVVEAEMDDNIYLSKTEIDMLLSTMSDDEKVARRRGKYVQMGGLIYKNFGPDNIVPNLLHSPAWKTVKERWQFICAMDHGFNNPTAWLWAALSPDGRIIIFDEHYESHQIVDYHANVVVQKNRHLGIEPLYMVGDPSIVASNPITATSVQLEYMSAGVPIVLGNNDVKSGINAVAAMFEKKELLVTSNCTNLLRELSRYRWSTWSSKKLMANRNVKEEPHKKDDHACDALRYLIASRPQFDATVSPEVENFLHAPSVLDPDAPRRDPDLVRKDDYKNPEYASAIDFTMGGEY